MSALPFPDDTKSYITHFSRGGCKDTSLAYSVDRFQGLPIRRCSFNQRWAKLPLVETAREGEGWRQAAVSTAVNLTLSNMQADDSLHVPSKTLVLVFTGFQGGKDLADEAIFSDEIRKLTATKHNLAIFNVGETKVTDFYKIVYGKLHFHARQVTTYSDPLI